MENRKNLKIIISGKEYTIYTDEDEKQINQAAQLLNVLIKSTIEKMPSVTESKRNLFVALQLATDLAKNKRMLERSENRIEKLTALINDNL